MNIALINANQFMTGNQPDATESVLTQKLLDLISCKLQLQGHMKVRTTKLHRISCGSLIKSGSAYKSSSAAAETATL